LDEKKGEDIVLLDLRGVAPFTDYFVVCSGTSNRMLRALMNAALDEVRESHKVKTRIEGEPLDGWMLADFGDVILHIFSTEQREFYSLEELWSEGKVLLHVQ
jgi:ribosome-associated protein